MRTGIRAANDDDAHLVAVFFTKIYEKHHGIGSVSALEMLERTVASLFTDTDPPTVYLSEVAGRVQGVAAVRHLPLAGECDLIAIQADDTIQGRGVAQTLLRHVVVECAALGGVALRTGVPLSDVRARGFLRREGFVALVDDLVTAPIADDATISYRLEVAAVLASGKFDDADAGIDDDVDAETGDMGDSGDTGAAEPSAR